MSDDFKFAAAEAALAHVEDGMKVGLGTGSTASLFVKLLARRVNDGLDVLCVPTSEATRALAEEGGIPLTTLDESPALDLTVDGADELDGSLRLIKGGGGALLREKIVAAASERMIVIADASKQVDTLGRFPLPIEVVPFGLGATEIAIERVLHREGLNGRLILREKGEEPFRTDGGHYILDAHLSRIAEPDRLAERLLSVPGVVEHGLFIGIADLAIVAGPDGVRTLETEG